MSDSLSVNRDLRRLVLDSFMGFLRYLQQLVEVVQEPCFFVREPRFISVELLPDVPSF